MSRAASSLLLEIRSLLAHKVELSGEPRNREAPVVCLTSAIFGEVEQQDVGAEVGQVVERFQVLL